MERANARRTFLDRTSGSEHDISWANSTSDEPHPLEILKTDDQSRKISSAAAHGQLRHRDMSQKLQRTTEQTTPPNGLNRTNTRPAMFEVSMADGTTLQVPTDWAMYMAAVDKKLRQIEKSTRLMASSMHHPNANSTRRESTEGMRRITFTEHTPASRNNENRRDDAQTRNIPSRQDSSGWELLPPGIVSAYWRIGRRHLPPRSRAEQDSMAPGREWITEPAINTD